MKRDILKKRKLKHIPANKVICEGGGKHSPFLLIRGKIRVGDYDVTRPGIFCMECAYGFPAISKITVVEETDIFKFNPNADVSLLRFALLYVDHKCRPWRVKPLYKGFCPTKISFLAPTLSYNWLGATYGKSFHAFRVKVTHTVL